MTTETLFQFATAALSVLGATISVLFAHRFRRAARLDEADDLALHFREPLLQAAFNLQSRLFNIGRMNFLGEFLTGRDVTDDEREYAVCNTVYLIGQYLGWVEAIRRESQYMDPLSKERNRRIAERLERVRVTFADSRELKDPVLRLFRGEQRAIGEVMLLPTKPSSSEVPRWECKGYAQFILDREQARVQRWFSRLEDDVTVLAKDLEPHLDRLTRLQRELLEVVDVLDPDGDRVPMSHRERL
jgi:hypothetical protein